MAITGYEIRPRSLTDQTVKRKYHLTGAADEADVLAWLEANVPTEVANLPRADFSADELDGILGDYFVDVNFGFPQNNGPSQDVDSLEYKFNFQAPGGHIYQSLQNMALYPDPSLGPDEGGAAEPGLFGGAINVVSDGGKYRVEGFNLSPPAEVFTLSYRVNNTTITGAYQLLVESLCGKVNSTTFRSRPAGSVMLVRATGGRDAKTKVWHIEFGFGYIPNTTNIPVGNITVGSKDGFDLLWTFYRTTKDDNANGMVKLPTYVLIERIFYRADLNTLNLPP